MGQQSSDFVPGHEDDIVQEGGLLSAVDSTDVLRAGGDNGSSAGDGVVLAELKSTKED